MPRCMERNKRTMYYAKRNGRTAITDANGNRTGEYTETYTTPVAFRAAITQPNGTVAADGNGLNDTQDIRIVCERPLPIDADTLLYVDTAPAEGILPDYIVTHVAPALRSMTVYARRARK